MYLLTRVLLKVSDMKKRIGFKMLFLTALSCSMLTTSCKKEGPGGKSSVSGTVRHHAVTVPNAIVYIKYGEMEFPGDNVSAYDASVVTDANAHFEFKELERGNYFLYAVGHDTTIMQNVKGGVGVVLKKDEAKASDVAVTE